MAEMKLFKLGAEPQEIKNAELDLDLNIANLIEQNSKLFFGVTFVANNYTIGAGRIPSVGLDENRCPVAFVYSSDKGINYLSKGLFFIDQLLSHKEKFVASVGTKLGKKAAEAIDWTNPRIICLSTGYNKYDRAAVSQVSRNISLIQYNIYGDEIIMFELIETNAGTPIDDGIKGSKAFATAYKKANADARRIFDDLCDYVLYFGESVTVPQLKNYVAFKKIKNFGAAKIEGTKITLNLNLEPGKYVVNNPKLKDVTFATKVGTGYVQTVIETYDEFEDIKPLLLDAYNRN